MAALARSPPCVTRTDGGDILPLAAILLTAIMSLAILARPAYTHQIVTATEPTPAETAQADDYRDGEDLLSALTRSVVDHRLGIDERLRVAAVRRQWLAELMEREPGRSAASGAVVGGARGAGAGAARARGRGREPRGPARGVPRGRTAGRGLSLRPAQGIRAAARTALRRRRAEPPDRHEREGQRDTRGAGAGPRRRRVGGSPGAAGPAEHVRRAQGAGDPAPIPRHPRDDGFADRGLGSDDDVRHDGLDGEQLLPGELVPADVAHGHGRRPAPPPDDRRELRLQPDGDARPAGGRCGERHRPRAVPPYRLRVPQ